MSYPFFMQISSSSEEKLFSASYLQVVRTQFFPSGGELICVLKGDKLPPDVPGSCLSHFPH